MIVGQWFRNRIRDFSVYIKQTKLISNTQKGIENGMRQEFELIPPSA